MPFHLPFDFHYFYNNTSPNKFNKNYYLKDETHNDKLKKDSEKNIYSESFFEIFGLKLYFDDLLILCILFFLYTEKIQNEELFICLILLLLT